MARMTSSRLAASRGSCLVRTLTATVLPLRVSSARQTEALTRSISRNDRMLPPATNGSMDDMCVNYIDVMGAGVGSRESGVGAGDEQDRCGTDTLVCGVRGLATTQIAS